MRGGAKLKPTGASVMLHHCIVVLSNTYHQVEAVKTAVSGDLSGRQSSRAITNADFYPGPGYVK